MLLCKCKNEITQGTDKWDTFILETLYLFKSQHSTEYIVLDNYNFLVRVLNKE
jgi:hypothetical protein